MPVPRVAQDAKRSGLPSNLPEASFKPGDKPEVSLNVSRGAIRAPSPDPSLLSIDDSNNIRLGRNPDYDPVEHACRHASRSPAPPPTFRGKLQVSWIRNKGLVLVLCAQLFGTLMNVTTRLLEIEGNDGKLLLQVAHLFVTC
jgi:hypothetical protein